MFRLIPGRCAGEDFGDHRQVDLAVAQGAILQGQAAPRADHAIVLQVSGQRVGGHDLRKPQRIVEVESQIRAVQREAECRAVHPRPDAGQFPHRKVGVVFHGDLQPQVFRRPAGFAENGHRLVRQPRHVMAFVAREEIAGHASQQRRPQSLGDLQVMDDDLGLGHGNVAPRLCQQVPSFLGHGMPMEDRAHAEFDVEPSIRRAASHGVQIAVAERAERADLEKHALQSEIVRQGEHAGRVESGIPRAVGIQAEFHAAISSLAIWHQRTTFSGRLPIV